MRRLIVAVALVIGLVGPSSAAAEPNDSPAGAGGPIQSGKFYDSTIDTENDRDWWVFYTGTSTQLDVSLMGFGPDDCFGPVMYLKDASGQILAGNGYPANRFETKHVLYTVGSGTFYVEVFPYNVAPCIGSEAKYRLWINSSPLLLASPPYLPPPASPPPSSGSTEQSAEACRRAWSRIGVLNKRVRRVRGRQRQRVRAQLRQARATATRVC